jgi:hypothetical protein
MAGEASVFERDQGALPADPLGLDKSSIAQLGDGLLQLRLRVHYDRPVPSDRLFNRLTRDQ